MKKLVRVQVCEFLLAVWVCCFAGCSTSEWVDANCPEEHVATRLPRDPASTYRHYGSMYESGFRAAESALASLIPGLSSTDTLKFVADDFRHYLTGERSTVQVQLERAVARLQENPCDDKARGSFQFLIQYVNFNGNYLRTIASACKDSSSNLRSMLEGYRRSRN